MRGKSSEILYMKSVTIAEAGQSFSALIAEVETFDEHVMITKNGRPSAVDYDGAWTRVLTVRCRRSIASRPV
jgi:hypothetical protein